MKFYIFFYNFQFFFSCSIIFGSSFTFGLLKLWGYPPDHPVHDEHVSQQPHDADERVERSDGHGYDHPRRATHRPPLLGQVLQPAALVRERHVVGDDGVQVGQRQLSSGDRERLHGAKRTRARNGASEQEQNPVKKVSFKLKAASNEAGWRVKKLGGSKRNESGPRAVRLCALP